MESDSDHFESADEDFISSDSHNDSEEEEKTVRHSVNVVKETEPKPTPTPTILEVKNVSLEEDTTNDNNTTTTTTTDSNINIIKKPVRLVEKRERPQKREPKTKLGTKLNVEDKDKAFWQAFGEAKKNEYAEPPQRETCWEREQPIDPSNKTELYSEKSKEPEQNFWDNEENYMELPRDEKSESQPTKQEIVKDEASSNSWGGWSNWSGMCVSTISNITQGVTKALETGIGIPDPEELAKQDRAGAGANETNEVKETPELQGGLFGLGNLVSGVSHITKLVETTGTKVLTGGLDTLEVIGKKTMEVLQDGDPGLKKKRALFKIDQNKPVLSQILREAKQKAEDEDKINEGQKVKKPHYETMFDDYQGLVHLEALEMLSKQCDIKLETLQDSLKGVALQDMQETMAQIKELCELPDEEEDNSLSDIEVVREKVEAAITEMNIQITYAHFLDTWLNIDIWLRDSPHDNPNQIHEKAIESLAQLTAIAVEQFHKAGELLLVKERRSTVDEADSLLQLTITLTGVVGAVAGKFSEKLNTYSVNVKDSNENMNSLITNIFLEAANSSTYMQDAFNLLIPVLQVGAI